MSVDDQESLKSWVDGATLSVHELNIHYQLPMEEIASFHDWICIYPYRGVIVEEGDRGKAIYLLRSGKVGIFKKVGNTQEQLATIEAVNFFGEMSLINNEPRSATVIALSKDVVVYKISKPNLHIILNNPKWADILVTRLSKNLAHNNEQLVLTSNQLGEVRRENERLHAELEACQAACVLQKRKTQMALNSILYFQQVVQGLAIVESKGWAYLNALSRISHALIDHYIPDMNLSENKVDMGVLRNCLSFIQTDIQDRIFKDLDQSIK